MARQTVLIIGASRGLGLALAEEWLRRGWHVIATTRGNSSRLDALAGRFGDALVIENLDILDVQSVRALHAKLDGRQIDVLFVNAGIALSNDKTPVDVNEQDFVDMMLTNALAPVRVVELLDERVVDGGVIAIMTSGLASIANGTGFWPLYSSSKAALNMLMKGYAAHHASDAHALLLMAPGWVRTDMGGDEAPLSIADSIPHVVDTIEANRGKRGLRYVDRFNTDVPW
ncbi:SDR family NAD(P)-dependent oxidoreductase [Novosphingobium sp. Leaf2]|uniref:SDR family NAD(P)-dependent oxidoreductase n=1 Tax=Novosphingobium sp. Leaf2 TaxID=1735670 RepID=UPI0007011DE4|nr:SDR family NAD(P)-dependent oxidoreductase [Novosphingobium sp. Leaf2]KQM22223.1 3-oxoacyl-ACP reductase [Novosphingobium sp. Leaf2]